MATKNCPNCRKELADIAVMCPGCGYKYTQSPTKKCKHCQSDIPKKAKLCPVCRKKQKHSVLGIILIILGVIGIIGTLGGNDSSSDTPSVSQDNSIRIEESQSFSQPEKRLTAEKFTSIDFDMTYEDVVGIVGEDGANISEVAVLDTTTAIYQWEEGISNFNVTFQNNAVVGKAQVGILESETAKVSLDMYNSIKSGMTYNEVVDILGAEGTFLSTSKVLDSVTIIYMWTGNTFGGNCNITFQDGVVFAKAQFGLE